MKTLDNYIIEKLHLNSGRKVFIDNKAELFEAIDEYYSIEFEKDTPEIIRYLENWADKLQQTDFKIIVSNWNKEFLLRKILNDNKINKFIEWVDTDEFSKFRNNNISFNTKDAVYNNKYNIKKSISLYLGENTAYIETYEMPVLIVPKDIKIK